MLSSTFSAKCFSIQPQQFESLSQKALNNTAAVPDFIICCSCPCYSHTLHNVLHRVVRLSSVLCVYVFCDPSCRPPTSQSIHPMDQFFKVKQTIKSFMKLSSSMTPDSQQKVGHINSCVLSTPCTPCTVCTCNVQYTI